MSRLVCYSLACCIAVWSLALETRYVQAQINYQVSGIAQLEIGGDIGGLDGASITFDATFDNSQGWNQIGDLVGITPDSSTVTISGASVAGSNGVFDLVGQTGDQPAYVNGNSLGEPDPFAATFFGSVDSFPGVFLADFFLTTQVAGIEGVTVGDSIFLEQFAPATYDSSQVFLFGAGGVGEYSFVTDSVKISAVKVPEPSSAVIGMAGLIGLIARRRR